MGRLNTLLAAAVWSGAQLLATPGSAAAQTLREGVGIALSQYPTILAAQARKDAAESDITRAQGAHWPQVAWSGTQSAYSTGNVANNWIQSPTVNLNVWSGGKIEADVDRSKALAEAGKQQQRLTRDDVAMLATEGYLNWAKAIALVGLARKNVAYHEKIRANLAIIAAVDVGRRIDLDQAEVRLENANLSLQQREAEKAIAALRLDRMLLSQMPSAPAGIDHLPGVLPATIAQALADINDKHPAIALQIAQIDAAKANVRTARSQHLPNVSVSYGKQVYQGSGQGDYVAQINVSVPIFTGGSATGATDTALAQLQAAEFDLQDLRLTLREKLLSAWTDASSAKGRGELGVRQSKTAQTLVEGYESQFKIGRRSLLDLLNVQSDLYTYQSNTVIAQFDLRVAQSRILAASGKLASSYAGARPELSDLGSSRGRLQLVNPDQGASAHDAMPVTVAASYSAK